MSASIDDIRSKARQEADDLQGIAGKAMPEISGLDMPLLDVPETN